MATRLTRRQVLAWRMRRQLLDPVGALAVAEVVERLCGVQAQVASSAELAVRVRRKSSQPGEVDRALAEGRLVKTWAMRGTLHLLTPERGGAFLSLIAAGRPWHRPSWQRYFGATPAVMDRLRDAVLDELAGGPLTREEMARRVVRRRGLAHVGEQLGSSWGTLLKPLAWQGALVVGPSRGNRVTFMRPDRASAHWRPPPEPDEAAPLAIAAYLGAYGPATIERFGAWLAGGWFGKRQLSSWVEQMKAELAEVEVEGQARYALAADVDEMAATGASSAVRLLPGFDQYVLGPGTADDEVTPAVRRSAVSRQAGWIAPVVVAGGVVSGTWQLDGEVVRVAWFEEAGKPPSGRLSAEVKRLAGIVGRELRLEVG